MGIGGKGKKSRQPRFQTQADMSSANIDENRKFGGRRWLG